MEAANKVFNNTIFLYIKMFITVFSSLYTTRLVLDSLGASDFGIFNLILGLTSMLLFFNTAMTQASQRFMSIAKGACNIEDEKSIFNISILLHFIVAIFLVALLILIEAILFKNLLKIDLERINTAISIYQFMIIGVFFMIIAVPYDAIINANENMLFVAILGIFESLIKLAVAFIITYYHGDKLYLFGLLMSLIFLFVFIIKGIYCHKKYDEAKINFKKYLNKSIMKKMAEFAGFTFLGTATQMFTNYGQGIILNIFFGTIVNAAQGIVNQITGQLGSFAITMLKALNPMITKSEGSGNRELMLKASYSGAKISFYLMMVFYIPVLIEMETIFNFWLVETPLYTIIFCKLLLIRNLIEQLYITLNTSILAVGDIKSFQIYNSIINLLPLPIAYLFFKYEYEPPVIYIIFIFYSLLHGFLHVYYAKTKCGMSIIEYFKEVIYKTISPFIIIYAISLIPYLYIENTIIRLISVVLLSFIIFIISIWSLGLNNFEKKFIKQKFIKIKEKSFNRKKGF